MTSRRWGVSGIQASYSGFERSWSGDRNWRYYMTKWSFDSCMASCLRTGRASKRSPSVHTLVYPTATRTSHTHICLDTLPGIQLQTISFGQSHHADRSAGDRRHPHNHRGMRSPERTEESRQGCEREGKVQPSRQYLPRWERPGRLFLRLERWECELLEDHPRYPPSHHGVSPLSREASRWKALR